jgi:hypothetical protein
LYAAALKRMMRKVKCATWRKLQRSARPATSAYNTKPKKPAAAGTGEGRASPEGRFGGRASSG